MQELIDKTVSELEKRYGYTFWYDNNSIYCNSIMGPISVVFHPREELPFLNDEQLFNSMVGNTMNRLKERLAYIKKRQLERWFCISCTHLESGFCKLHNKKTFVDNDWCYNCKDYITREITDKE